MLGRPFLFWLPPALWTVQGRQRRRQRRRHSPRNSTGESMTKIQTLYAALLRATADAYAAANDAQSADAYARESSTIQAIAAAPIEDPDDYAIKVKVAHNVARDEADDGEYLDGRLRTLLAAIELDAARMVQRLRELDARAAA